MIEYNQFKEHLCQEIQELEKLKQQLEVQLSNAPEGTLHILKKSKKYVQYYVYQEDQKRKYLSTAEEETAVALAQKSYDQKVLSIF